jgi:hypothetical protein
LIIILMRELGGHLLTWVYDEIGCAGALLDDFCIRNLSGETIGWVFGLSLFSLKGEHTGWFEEGVFYDVQNKVIGFVPGAPGLRLEQPALAPEPPLPAFKKRPYVPSLRGRTSRPAGKGWSSFCLATYLEFPQEAAPRVQFMSIIHSLDRAAGGDCAH